MAQNREPFLSRWSRRKRAARQPAAQPKPPAQGATPPPELPPIDSLTPDSDFSVFMHEQVDEKLRRAALHKLFSDPALNVVDGLDDYAEDFNQLETLAAGAAAGLEHAKRTLFGEAQDENSQAAATESAASTDSDAAPSRAPQAEAAQADAQPGAAAQDQTPRPAGAETEKKA